MNDTKKIAIMKASFDEVTKIIQNRIKLRTEALTALSSSSLDGMDIPESVKLKREDEAGRLRAQLTELNDILSLVTLLKP